MQGFYRVPFVGDPISNLAASWLHLFPTVILTPFSGVSIFFLSSPLRIGKKCIPFRAPTPSKPPYNMFDTQSFDIGTAFGTRCRV